MNEDSSDSETTTPVGRSLSAMMSHFNAVIDSINEAASSVESVGPLRSSVTVAVVAAPPSSPSYSPTSPVPPGSPSYSPMSPEPPASSPESPPYSPITPDHWVDSPLPSPDVPSDQDVARFETVSAEESSMVDASSLCFDEDDIEIINITGSDGSGEHQE